jgi:hypothetical protein
MGVSLSDLSPQPFNVTIRGHEIQVQPPSLKHAMKLAKYGSVLENPREMTDKDIEQSDAAIREVIGELAPDLKGAELDFQTVMHIVSIIMGESEPDDNQELNRNNVKINTDPKA